VALLDRYRVLELSDERALMTGRLLADFGADVVHVEPLEGSAARRCPPLAGDRSMYWSAYAANKRSVSLPLSGPDGQATLRDLVGAADFFVTSRPPAELAGYGVHWETVLKQHPHLIYVLVTPFGSTGPKGDWADSDLVVWAAGGPLDPHRDTDRPPVRLSTQQAYLHAAAP
jgi:crotonobetainyl-CoA:carnitine CoA-transferase CaiB-like acyl-CoA transferase